MVLKRSLLSLLSLAAATQAAVTFYGSKGSSGDVVKCASNNVTDNHLSLVFGTIYPGQVMRNSTGFKFDDPMTCGSSDAALSIEFNCEDLGGNTTCAPHNGTTTRSQQRSPVKRDDNLKCNLYSGQCKHQYQSSTGTCQRGYKLKAFEVKGYGADAWCTKECTEEESLGCAKNVCTKEKKDCEGGGTLNVCVEALVSCKGSPVKMDQTRCKTDFINKAGSFSEYCGGAGVKGLEYNDGTCTLDASAYDAYIKEIEQNYFSGPPRVYYPPPPGYKGDE